mmetsp:Transcript_26526/g.66895  ORF Transcript_26526/g.66895 Transcript_26526/m.66895 type:complete len:235 (-) Transcript_26526:1229-1933(-)
MPTDTVFSTTETSSSDVVEVSEVRRGAATTAVPSARMQTSATGMIAAPPEVPEDTVAHASVRSVTGTVSESSVVTAPVPTSVSCSSMFRLKPPALVVVVGGTGTTRTRVRSWRSIDSGTTEKPTFTSAETDTSSGLIATSESVGYCTRTKLFSPRIAQRSNGAPCEGSCPSWNSSKSSSFWMQGCPTFLAASATVSGTHTPWSFAHAFAAQPQIPPRRQRALRKPSQPCGPLPS